MRLCKITTLATEYKHLDDDELLAELSAYRLNYLNKNRIKKEDREIWQALLMLAQSRGIHENLKTPGVTDANTQL